MEPEIFQVLDLLRQKYRWFDKIMNGMTKLVVDKNSEIARLTRECAEWKSLAVAAEEAHTQGYREGRDLAKIKILDLNKQIVMLEREHKVDRDYVAELERGKVAMATPLFSPDGHPNIVECPQPDCGAPCNPSDLSDDGVCRYCGGHDARLEAWIMGVRAVTGKSDDR